MNIIFNKRIIIIISSALATMMFLSSCAVGSSNSASAPPQSELTSSAVVSVNSTASNFGSSALKPGTGTVSIQAAGGSQLYGVASYKWISDSMLEVKYQTGHTWIVNESNVLIMNSDQTYTGINSGAAANIMIKGAGSSRVQGEATYQWISNTMLEVKYQSGNDWLVSEANVLIMTQ